MKEIKATFNRLCFEGDRCLHGFTSGAWRQRNQGIWKRKDEAYHHSHYV